MDEAVERAITCIRERYSEPLSLTEIAKSAMLSRYYFVRIFRKATGITPCRFLAAVRIYQAKRLLLSTPMTITEISFAVGYNSLGSFTNYFTYSVGVPPSAFRRIGREETVMPPAPRPALRGEHHGVIAGQITMPPRYSGAWVYVGAFATPLVQHQPAAATIIDVPGTRPYLLPGVPAGGWFVRAVAVADTADPEPWARRTLLVGGGPVRVTPGMVTGAAISLHPSQPTDPPVLLALPGLEPWAPHRPAAAPPRPAAGAPSPLAQITGSPQER